MQVIGLTLFLSIGFFGLTDGVDICLRFVIYIFWVIDCKKPAGIRIFAI